MICRLFRQRTCFGLLLVLALFAGNLSAHAAGTHLAANFVALPKAARVVVVPPDVELFSISAGGVLEPKADWTEAAHNHIHNAVHDFESSTGLSMVDLKEADADEFDELSSLHAAVARSIALHHFGPSNLALPTKNGQLDWSLGDAVAPLRQKTEADYALFIWVRDSYASAERQATMVVMALLGVGLYGGVQTGYASLVDLRNGQVVWFNRLARASGDLREAAKARESVKALLTDFPDAR